MQYGLDLVSYKRKNDNVKNRDVVDINYISVCLYLLIGFLISRVSIFENIAPFGFAFLMIVLVNKNKYIGYSVALGTAIGYISIYIMKPVSLLFVSSILFMVLINELIINFTSKNKVIVFMTTIFLVNLISLFMIHDYNFLSVIISSFVQVASVFPIYYILSYSILCTENIKTKYLYCIEELVSIVLLLSLMVAGLKGINIVGISISNIAGILLVLICAFVNGTTTGATIGLSIGAIVGVATGNVMECIGIYAICGLVVGLFKDIGKFISGIAFFIVFVILIIYNNATIDFNFIEGVIGLIAFYAIPLKVYESLSKEFNYDKKMVEVNNGYMERVNELFLERLDNLSNVVYGMSESVSNLMNNERLLMKTKSSALVENLADRVCASCDKKNVCWKREIHYTYTSFTELIQYYQEGKNIIPNELNYKCTKLAALLRSTEAIVNNHILSEMWKKRLMEGRKILSTQLENMCLTMKEIVGEFDVRINVNNELEKQLCRVLNKEKIDYKDIFIYEDSSGRINIKLSMKNCYGKDECVKKILPIVNEVVGINMCISGDGCNIDPKNNNCVVSFEEKPKFHVNSYTAKRCKEGEKFSGDSYTYGRYKSGNYVMVVSDGMGSGPEAGKESKAAVDLIERFAKAGFDKITAINTINSVMNLKFEDEEKFTTLDMANLDLYSGSMDILKVGAVATYIKRGNKVDVIKSKTLPIGVLDRVDVDIVNKKVKSGDIIVMLSDGVIDSGDDKVSEDWIKAYLENCNNISAKEIVEELIDKAISFNNGKSKDDMTVLASKVYSI